MIMKFNSPDDPNFQTVCFYMEELIETAKKKSQFAGAAAGRLLAFPSASASFHSK